MVYPYLMVISPQEDGEFSVFFQDEPWGIPMGFDPGVIATHYLGGNLP